MAHAVPVDVSRTRGGRRHVGIVRVRTLQLGIVGAAGDDCAAVSVLEDPAEVCRLELTFITGQVRDAIGIIVDDNRQHWRWWARRRWGQRGW